MRPVPNLGSQSGGLNMAYQGASVHLVTGERFNVLEDYEEAHRRLWPPPLLSTSLSSLESHPKAPEQPAAPPESTSGAEDTPRSPRRPGRPPKAEGQAEEATTEEKDED